MSHCSDDSRLDQSNYLQIFEQFFDRADDLNEVPCFQKLSPKSQFPKNSMHGDSKTTSGNCIRHASADNKTDMNPMNKFSSYSHFSHQNNKSDTKNNSKPHKNNNDETYNRENVKNLECRKNTTYLRRNMLKRQNGFCEDEEEDEKEGVLNVSALDQLDDDVFEMIDRKHKGDSVTNGYKNDLINSTFSSKKSIKTTKNQNFSNVSCKNKVCKNKSRRTSVPLQSINLQNNYEYTLESNCKKQKHNKSQSFKHDCKQYYFNTENKNPLNNPNKNSPFFYKKQRKPKTPILVDSFRSSENPTKYRHHSHEQSHEDPAQKKLQLVRLMQGLDCTVVRSFVTSSKGLVNRGDSFRKKFPQVTPDLVIGCLPYLQNEESQFQSRKDSLDLLSSSEPSKATSSPKQSTRYPINSQTFNVLVLGDQSVGKTSLLQQFITSEFMASADPVFDKEFEKRVSVQVDDQEATLAFVDLPIQMQKKGLPYNETEAFLVCYSITDRESFEYAVETVQSIRQRSDAALILVANKSDLVRSRKVGFEESRAVCQKHNCKFVEVSAAFNHRVDELLVGLVHQIRLNPTRQRAKSVPNTTDSTISTDSLLSSKSSHASGCFKGARHFLTEFILGFRKTKSRSCDNLWTL